MTQKLDIPQVIRPADVADWEREVDVIVAGQGEIGRAHV